nr:hypothetical protein [Tanacetum cinerariifolium]
MNGIYSPNGCWGIFVNSILQPIRGLDLRPPPAQYLVHQSLAASRRHVAASYWTVAGDVAATSSPATAGQRRSTPPAIGQRRWVTVVIGGQQWRSTMVNAAYHRSTVAVNDGRLWRTTVDCRWTTIDHHRTTGQRWLVGRSGSGLDRVQVGSESGPPRGMPRVSHVCPHGIHVAADVDNMHKEELNSGPHAWSLSQNQENHCARQWSQ